MVRLVLFSGRDKWTNKLHAKRDLLKMMKSDNEDIRNSVQVQAGYLLFKNSKFSRDFAKEWLKICENEKAITDIASENEYPEFIDHRHDQSILTLLYLKHPNKIYRGLFQEAGKYFWRHRRRELDADISLPMWKYVVDIDKFLDKLWVF